MTKDMFNLDDFVTQVPVEETKEAPQDKLRENTHDTELLKELVKAVKAVPEVGPEGPKGEKGIDGAKGLDGLAGTKGLDGADGADGISVVDTFVQGDDLFIRLSDGKLINAGDVRGPQGLQGPQGTGGGGGYRGGGFNPTASTQIANKIDYITEASQLSGELDSTKLYFIDGEIDMGTTSIVVPENGLNIRGHGFGISGLYSTEDNFNLFVTNGVTYSGDLFITDMDIRISGVGSKVFAIDNLENFNACEWNTVNFIACTSLGDIKDYRQGLGRNVAWISCKEGLTMTGAWSGGFAILDSIVVGAPMTGVLFKAGTDLLIGGSFRSNINILGLGTAGGYFTDFAPSNFTLDGGFSLTTVRANPAVDNIPNMPATSPKANIKGCSGIGNTYPGGAIRIADETTVTISTIGVLEQITSTAVLNEAYWFSVSNTNGITLDSTQVIEVDISGSLSFSGSSNREMAVQLRKYISSTASYVDIGPVYLATLNGGSGGQRAENVTFAATTSMSEDDRIEVWVKNLTDTTNITVLEAGQFQVFER